MTGQLTTTRHPRAARERRWEARFTTDGGSIVVHRESELQAIRSLFNRLAWAPDNAARKVRAA